MRSIYREGMPYAELWRALIPVAIRIDRPRPTYWQVRRFATEERRRQAERRELIESIADEILAGRWHWTLRKAID
jgi:hypothetical protein